MLRAVRCAAVAFCVLMAACEPAAEKARRRGGSGGGEALSSSCAGLVPPGPSPTFVRPAIELGTNVISLTGEPNCTDGFTSDGDGNVAIVVRASAGFDAVVEDSDGARTGVGGRFSADWRGPWPELEGYDVDDTSPAGALLARHFHKGTGKPVTLAIPDVLGFAAARSYGGGQLLVYGVACSGGVCLPGGWSLLAQRVSSQGLAVGPAGLVAVGAGPFPKPARDRDPRLFAAVSLGGSSLVLWRAIGLAPNTGRLLGRWVGADGVALGPTFEAAKSWPATGTVSTLPLIGGGIAVQLDGAWMLRIAEGQPLVSAPPAFLLQRPNTTFELVRRNTAYASASRKGDSHCRQRVEILAPSGTSCGDVHYSLGEAGRSCKGAPVAFGWDGTFIARSGQCAYRWWPHSLE